jgi:hypothetical protein
MQRSREQELEMLAYEAFIRRAAELDLPFMLKGSYVTRQYFKDPEDRIPNDLDWVYLPASKDPQETVLKLDDWMTKVTEMFGNDGVRFRSFTENAFWRMIDYAMADDFPTTSTDLKCWIGEDIVEPCRIDVSFNLDMEVPSVPLLYQPLRGNAFMVPKTVPLALQVSWKLHQTLVRPRYKDLFDLIHLVQHPDFTTDVLEQTWQALVNECRVDGTNHNRIGYFLSGEQHWLFGHAFDESWQGWRYNLRGKVELLHEQTATAITNVEKLTPDLAEFKEQFRQALLHAGFRKDQGS